MISIKSACPGDKGGPTSGSLLVRLMSKCGWVGAYGVRADVVLSTLPLRLECSLPETRSLPKFFQIWTVFSFVPGWLTLLYWMYAVSNELRLCWSQNPSTRNVKIFAICPNISKHVWPTFPKIDDIFSHCLSNYLSRLQIWLWMIGGLTIKSTNLSKTTYKNFTNGSGLAFVKFFIIFCISNSFNVAGMFAPDCKTWYEWRNVSKCLS